MQCICPECKNAIEMSRYANVSVGDVIECNFCGIVLAVRAITDGSVEVEIVDEGK